MIDCVTANERRYPQTKSDILYIDAPIASAAPLILHLLLISSYWYHVIYQQSHHLYRGGGSCRQGSARSQRSRGPSLGQDEGGGPEPNRLEVNPQW